MASLQDERGYNQGFKPSHALTVRTQRRVDRVFAEFNQTNKIIKVLELGSGAGELAHLLLQKAQSQNCAIDITGCDLSEKFVTAANAKYKNNHLRFIQFDIAHGLSSMSDTKYDYIIGNGLLHHLHNNLDTVLRDIKKQLTENGKIIFWEPNLLNPYVYFIFNFFRTQARLEPTEMAFSKSYITNQLIQAGFKKINVRPLDFVLPNTPDSLITANIRASNILERIPLLRNISQSLFIVAQ